MSTGLGEFAAELRFAAGAGAKRIASSATSSGNVQAKLGIAMTKPGPGLRSVLGRPQALDSRRASTAVDATQIPAIADRMARQIADQGAALLSGGKT